VKYLEYFSHSIFAVTVRECAQRSAEWKFN